MSKETSERKSSKEKNRQPELDASVENVRRRLRDQVRLSPLSQRQIEDHLGWSRGYLSQVLQGHITLSVGHLLGILSALERRPEVFFAEVSGAASADSIDEIRQKLLLYDHAFAQLRAKGLIDPD